MTYTNTNTAYGQTLQVSFDKFGFLINEQVWTSELANQIALREGVETLGDRHWLVINHLRDKYQSFGGMPGIRSVCRSSGVPKHEVQQLFGTCMNVWKIAGLADPGPEVRNYMA